MKSIKVKDEITDPHLYKLYWSLMLEDILIKLKCEVTSRNKHLLHEFNKRMLGYESIAGRSKDFLSFFLFEVTVWWAVEIGIFVRSNGRQPEDIADRPFSEVKDLL